MNQILITEKLYITPELKRKKKIYKLDFIVSLFLVCILTSLYIYAEYDRNKSEETSQQILADMNEELQGIDTTVATGDVLLVVLDGTEEDIASSDTALDISSATQNATISTNNDGYQYKTIASISIPKINLNYPIVQGTTGSAEEMESLLKISLCKYWGCEPNEVGNFCIVGHNYRNSKFFSKAPTLVIGDTFAVTDITGRTITYVIYDKYTVSRGYVLYNATNRRKERSYIDNLYR